LLHGDYRLDNLLFRQGESGEDELIVLDYQAMCHGRPGADVAYFVTTALTAEHRTEEELLLKTYHDELVAAGVTDYSYAELVADCSMSKEVYAHRIVGAADILDTEKADGSEALLVVMQLRVLDWLEPS
jgi:aminoglycoside/choline kinase family phosphotransferase